MTHGPILRFRENLKKISICLFYDKKTQYKNIYMNAFVLYELQQY